MKTLQQTAIALGFFAIFMPVAGAAHAQISLTDLPTWTGNTRFATSAVSEVKHPSLSINGFDCGASCDYGYGLKQILEQAPTAPVETSLREVYDDLVAVYSQTVVFSPTTRQHVNSNVRIMEAKAFAALATYIIEQNNESIPDGLPSALVAAGSLKSILLASQAWEVDDSYPDEGDDGVKWAASLSGQARALDLYLALENAFCYYGAHGDTGAQNECNGTTSNYLLSESQKDDVFGLTLSNNIQEVNYLGGAGFLPPLLNGFDAQPGNHPLKVQTSIGTASLVMNDMSAVTSQTFRDYVKRAMEASLRTAGNERHYYFNYQTDDGKRFFAEGPYYFQYALNQVIPFWHTIRVNNMLGYHPNFNAPDPFNSAQFTTPLEWLADVSTLKGLTPPLDDGNKFPINISRLLRWSGAYGTASTGQKFAWVAEQLAPTYGGPDSQLLVELSIPRLSVGLGSAPPEELGNTQAGQTGEGGEQLIVLRRGTSTTSCDGINELGDCHYALLNAESGDAYGRGEGHEQPDQAQLLYYIEETSYLMDSGYDHGHGWYNSTWNDYRHHNVLQNTFGYGLPSPLPHPAGRKDILVVNPFHLYRTHHDNLDVMHVAQRLPHFITQENGSQHPADYTRKVLFVDDAEPYLIDYNRGIHYLTQGQNPLGDRQFKVSYHVNSNSAQLNNFTSDGNQFIVWNNVGGSGKKFYLFPVSFEYPIRAANSDVLQVSDTAEEINGSEVNIQRVDVQDFKTVGGTYRPFFSVASIIKVDSSTPSYAPKLLWEEYETDEYQGWVWQQNATTFDVFVGRSAGVTSQADLAFNPASIDATFPAIWLKLPAAEDYGFVRIIKQGATGTIDTSFQLNIVLGQAPPLTAGLSGDDCIEDGDKGYYGATAAGGLPPYTIDYYTYRVCDEMMRAPTCNQWILTGSGMYLLFGGYGEDFKVRATVTDAEQNSVNSNTIYVNVVPSGSGLCEEEKLSENEKEDALTKEQAAAKQGASMPVSAGALTEAGLDLPESVVLKANYPNPFNPSTEIRFELPEATLVSLTVYDLMGRSVAELVNGRVGAGRHQVTFDASMLPSGTYIYRLIAGSSTQTRRMILVK